MKKVLIIVAIALASLVATAFIFRAEVFMLLMSSQIAPDHDFSAQPPPAAPDYRQADSWAALPEVQDPSDQLPEGVTPEPTGVAVFFVHPTSYFGKTWNQPLDAERANWVVDERILRHQASVFNSCCDIYAPRYRQATFFSFMQESSNAEAALDLAYQDVVAAFEAFIARLQPDQPFVIAGHSQGSRHTAQLVAEEIAGSQLQSRMVAAYLIGFSVMQEALNGVPICDDAKQTGCVLGWNAVDGDSGGLFGGDGTLICVNPLTWRADTSYASHNLNTGAIGFASYGEAEEGEDITTMLVEPEAADARCTDDGHLAVPALRSDGFPERMMGNSLHVYDYSLFHMNIRTNVAQRIGAYLTQP